MSDVINAVLPVWVQRLIKDYVLKKKSGSLTINFSDGGVRNIKIENVIKPPKD